MSECTESVDETDADVVVVGGGLVGAVTAMYLAPRTGRVLVLEQGGDPRAAGSGAGRSLMIMLSARGWRVLRELGLEEPVRRICLPLRGRTGHLPGGEVFTPYSRGGEPIWAVERHRLLAVLLDEATRTPGVRIVFDRTVAEVDLDAPAVLTAAAGGRSRARGSLLLGCDGARSVVRSALVARGAAREERQTLPVGYQEITFEPGELDRTSMHYWPTGDALFGAFPVPGTDHFSGGAFFRRRGPAPSYAAARSGPQRAEQFRLTFPEVARWVPDLEEQLASKPVASIPLVRCTNWRWRDRVALVGDAGHAMAPFMGHGMNCGFEDARVLATALDTVPDRRAALTRYVGERRDNADAIADISYGHYRTMAGDGRDGGDDLQRTTTVVADRLTALLPEQFMPIYERCSFTEQDYADALRRERDRQDSAAEMIRRHGRGVAEASDEHLMELVLGR